MSFSRDGWRDWFAEALCCLLALPAFLWYDRDALNPFFEPKWFALSLALLALLFILLLGLSRTKVSKLSMTWLLLLLGWLVWKGVSLCWLPSSTMGLAPLSQWIVVGGFGLVGILWTSSVSSPRLLEACTGLAFIEASVGLIQALRLPHELPRILIGTAGYHTFLADTLVVLFPFPIILLFRKSLWQRLFAGVTALLVLLALVLCESRAAFIALPLSVAVMLMGLYWFAARSRTRQVFLVLLVASALLVPGASLWLFHRPGGPIARTQEDLSSRLVGRKLIWLASCALASDHPMLGVGLGGFPYAYYDYQGRIFETHSLKAWYPAREVVRAAHDEFLQELCETGAPGALLLGALLVLPLGGLLLAMRRGPPDPLLGIALFSALIAMIPSVLLAFPFQVPLTAALDFLVLGAGIGISMKPTISLPWRKYLLLVIPLVVAGTIILGASYLSSRWLERGLGAEERDPLAAERDYQRGIALAPDKGMAKGLLGAFETRRGNLKVGEQLLLEALATLKDTYIYEDLGRAYQQEGHYEDSFRMYRKAAQGGIRYIPDRCDQATVLAMGGKGAEAREILMDLLHRLPGNCRANLSMAHLELRRKRYADALNYLDTLHCKKKAEAELCRGTALLGLGRFKEAEKQFYGCLAQDPKNLDAMNNLALEFALTGRIPLARSMYENVLNLDSSNTVALANLKALRATP